MSTATIKETLLREVNVLPVDYYPKVLHFIESLKENSKPAVRDWDNEDVDDWSDEDWEAWLVSNPPIPIEDDPTISPEHLERLRQRFMDIDEGKTKVIPFSPEEWKEFCQEMEHSPESAFAKAESRRCYLAPKQT
jgi:hypothetical protein